MSLNSGEDRADMRVGRWLLLGILLLGVVQGCEDDPILEPTDDDSGGGSYGSMSPLVVPGGAGSAVQNPAIF